MIPRREFIKHTAIAAAAPLIVNSSLFAQAVKKDKLLFKISLAQWSLHRMLKSGKLDALDFASFTKKTFDINAIEYVNSFFKERAEDNAYLAQLKNRAKEHGIKSLLIMVDGEGALGDPDKTKRTQAIENHYRWVTAAKFLGCHSIRVNAQSDGTYEEQISLAADGLGRLTEFASKHELSVIVENHGGLSSNGKWLASVMKKVDNPRCGTLPDFGNFCLDWNKRDEPDAWYDRYQGVKELMPFAKAVSAKSYDFDEAGNDTHTDFLRMMKIVLDAGYQGFVGIEYEGEKLNEVDGIKATKKLLEKVRKELTAKVGSSN